MLRCCDFEPPIAAVTENLPLTVQC